MPSPDKALFLVGFHFLLFTLHIYFTGQFVVITSLHASLSHWTRRLLGAGRNMSYPTLYLAASTVSGTWQEFRRLMFPKCMEGGLDQNNCTVLLSTAPVGSYYDDVVSTSRDPTLSASPPLTPYCWTDISFSHFPKTFWIWKIAMV